MSRITVSTIARCFVLSRFASRSLARGEDGQIGHLGAKLGQRGFLLTLDLLSRLHDHLPG